MILTLDCETTTYENGNPFSTKNKLCMVGCKINDEPCFVLPIEYNEEPYGSNLHAITEFIQAANLVVGFNLKFDLSWLKRYLPGLSIENIWDCQIAEYVLSGQTTMFPSLNECLEKYSLPLKLDEVKEEYWDKGLDTTEVPLDLLSEYLRRDVDSTYALYLKQLEHPEYKGVVNILEVSMKDALILRDMEQYGLKLNFQTCEEHKLEVEKEIEGITNDLKKLTKVDINWKSPKQVSIYLFGGKIQDQVFEKQLTPLAQTESDLTYGLSDEELANVNAQRLASKPKKPEIQRVWSVAEGALKSLQINARIKDKKLIDLLLKYKQLEKLVGTYLKGIPDTVRQMGWTDGCIHGTFNTCATRTGRLSSSKPNLQNFPEEMQRHVVSRYE